MPHVRVLFVPKDLLERYTTGTVLGHTTVEQNQVWAVITEIVTQDGAHKRKIGSLVEASQATPEEPHLQVFLDENPQTQILISFVRNLTIDHRTKIIVYDRNSLNKCDLVFLLHNVEERTHINFLIKCSARQDSQYYKTASRTSLEDLDDQLPDFLRPLLASSFISQCLLKISTISSIYTGRRSTKGVILWNRVVILLLDMLLGLVCYHYLSNICSVDEAVQRFLKTTDGVVTWLEGLITWLMGAPAGLKLNARLSHTMGNFFLFHIYLWRNYIHLVIPFLKTFILLSLFLSQFGLSFLLSAAIDLICVATIHIYCFYAYAARAYNMFLVVIRSLWRLFRGRKWNPLRNRVDSYSYDVDQLITGTVGFCVLLFLLPTVTLYYGVFAALWLAVLSIRGSFWCLQQILNYNPVALCIVWIAFPCKLKGNFCIDFYGENSLGCSLLHLRTSSTSFGRALDAVSGTPLHVSASAVTAVIRNVLQGHKI